MLRKMDHPFDKQETKASIVVTIRDMLWKELPESYSDESGNWYRVYKSGWVEQGGRSAIIAGGATATVTLFKSYTASTYTIIVQPVGVYSNRPEANNTIPSRTESSFVIACGQYVAQAFSWYASKKCLLPLHFTAK